jgi:maleylpyruvate isomerase
MCGIICSDTHPLNNLRVLNQLRLELGANEQQVSKWIHHWIDVSFPVLESMVKQHGRGFAFGDMPTLADCCLLPQIYSARRFDVSMDPFPNLVHVERKLQEIDQLAIAIPEYQTKTC